MSDGATPLLGAGGGPALRITAEALEPVLRAAREGASCERMGLLGARPGVGEVSVAVPLDAAVTAGSARAGPQAVRDGCRALATLGAQPVGIVHSHAGMHPYHSSTDTTTFARLAPSLVDRWLQPLARSHDEPPFVTGPTTAELPHRDGGRQRVELGGPGGGGAVSWCSVDVSFGPPTAEPAIRVDRTAVELVGAGVVLRLGVPLLGTVTVGVAGQGPIRRATAWSLVVNARGEMAAFSCEVYDLDGVVVTTPEEPCPVSVVGHPDPWAVLPTPRPALGFGVRHG